MEQYGALVALLLPQSTYDIFLNFLNQYMFSIFHDSGSHIKEMRCSAAEPRNDFKMKRRAEAVLGVSLDSEDSCERGPKKQLYGCKRRMRIIEM